jgi:predicted ester cyclase
MRWTARGTHEGDFMGIASTGRPIEATTIGTWLVADGKFSEAWPVYEAFGMMQQLDVTPGIYRT